MTAPTHIAFGVSATLLWVETGGGVPGAAEWFWLALGTLAPDIDSTHSMISRPGSLFNRFLSPRLRRFFDSLGRLISIAANTLFGHRNAIHWPIIGVALALLGASYDLSWLLWFGLGYLLHILGDALTRGGVPLFGPLSRKNISLLPMRTGSLAERMLFLSLSAFICWRGWHHLPPDTKDWLNTYIRIFVG